MDKNEFIEKIADLDDEILSELNEELDEELNKTMKNRDERKIIELSNAIADIKGYTPSEEDVKRNTEAILAKLDNKVPKRRNVIKALSTTAACLVAVFVLNQGIAYAFDVKMFPKLYEVVDGAIVIHMDQDRKETQQILSEIKTKCAEYDISSPIITYLPEGFVLTKLEYQDNGLTIWLDKGDVRVSMIYVFNVKGGNVGLPSDEGNVEEKVINGKPYLISMEDNQYRALYVSDKFIFNYTSLGLDYQEAENMVNSLT
ncbi:MAG: DUF4367 domain-containing protein [Ruminococcus sp.]|nr:DUF4367 domain-containing protein [Ruminococcus sp.]